MPAVPRSRVAAYVVVAAVAAADVVLLGLALTDEPPPSAIDGAQTSTTAAATTQRATTTESRSEIGRPLCRDIEIEASPAEPVHCRTSSAILTIAGEDDPVLLGGTHVRLLSATLSGSRLTTRVRVRNETEAEQGILAGGQELYVNLGGIRVDAVPPGDVRVPSQTGRTVTLRFALTPRRVVRLRGQGNRAELGIKPWTEEGSPSDTVGVIRFVAASDEG